MEDKLETLKNIVLSNSGGRHGDRLGIMDTPVHNLKVFRREEPTGMEKYFCASSCVMVLNGRKEMVFAGERFSCVPGHYMIMCTEIPVNGRIIEASPQSPLIGILVSLDRDILASLIYETSLQNRAAGTAKYILGAMADDSIIDPFLRLALLIGKPEEEQRIMSPIILRELYYRVLSGPLGSGLRAMFTRDSGSWQIAKAISLLKEKYRQKLNIETLAQNVGMSPSSFYRTFRNITHTSPLQYQKMLRLTEAQRMMIAERCDAATASYRVGYESPAQFSREYKRMFGAPPREDTRNLA